MTETRFTTDRLRLAAALAGLETGDCTLLVVPSLTFNPEELAKIPGAVHFEERMLWLLRVLRNLGARVIYVTSEQLPDRLVGYSAALTGVGDARARLRLISCDDPAPNALTSKVLVRPSVQRDIRAALGPDRASVMMCHVATEAENTLAKTLGIPLFACPPELSDLGSKSACRRIFRAAGVPLPDGQEALRDRQDILAALRDLQRRHPGIRRAVVKLNDSFAGGGNAIFHFPDPGNPTPAPISDRDLEALDFVDPGETPDRYMTAFSAMGGIVEEFIEAERKTSPSVQCILMPDGTVRVASTHEQLLGGRNNQTYLGCSFPARAAYRVEIANAAERIGAALTARGVTGHISIDFVCVETATEWAHFAIEINLRMGGATAPLSYLECATAGRYDAASGRFRDAQGVPLYYKSADRLQSAAYRRLDAGRLLDAAAARGLHFDPATGTGALFYMLGALPTVGKLGLVAVDHSRAGAEQRYQSTVAVLDEIAAL